MIKRLALRLLRKLAGGEAVPAPPVLAYAPANPETCPGCAEALAQMRAGAHGRLCEQCATWWALKVHANAAVTAREQPMFN